MRPAPLALAAAVIAFLAAFNLYSTVYAANHNIPTVIVLSRYYWDGEIVLCPPEELKDDAQWAAEKWNRAIQYFSLRYMLLDAAKTRIRVSSEGDDRCNIFFEYLDTPIGCEGGAVVAGIEFIEPPSSALNMEAATPLKAAKIYLWRGLDDQGRRAMILHEIARLLGVVKLFYSRQPPYRSASEPWGSLDVTSIDVYALFLKNRHAGASGELIEAMVPWTLPYTTVEEDLFHTSIALCVSILAAIAAYLALSGRWKVAG